VATFISTIPFVSFFGAGSGGLGAFNARYAESFSPLELASTIKRRNIVFSWLRRTRWETRFP
jgi:hypothetical protein